MMEYQITSQDVTLQDYPVLHLPSAGSREKMDINMELDSSISILIRQKRLMKPERLYKNFLSLLEADFSSVLFRFEVRRETSVMEIKEISEEMIISEMLENDFIVRIPPVKEYTVRVKKITMEKGTPKIVEPEVV